jgi:hypothetical protein
MIGNLVFHRETLITNEEANPNWENRTGNTTPSVFASGTTTTAYYRALPRTPTTRSELLLCTVHQVIRPE